MKHDVLAVVERREKEIYTGGGTDKPLKPEGRDLYGGTLNRLTQTKKVSFWFSTFKGDLKSKQLHKKIFLNLEMEKIIINLHEDWKKTIIKTEDQDQKKKNNSRRLW